MPTTLITGGAGYIGSHVIVALSRAGRRCVSLDNHSNSSPLAAARVRELVPGAVMLEGDIRDAARVREVVREHGCDSVIHMAGLKAVGESNEKPLLYYDNNVGGTLSLLSVLRETGVRRFVFMSVVPTPYDKSVTTFRLKRLIEEKIQGSGLAYSIFRGDFFMDDWFALMGSTIPLRGAKAHTLRRPFWFAKGFLRFAGSSIDKRGVALVPGDGSARHTPVALDDVASILTAAALEAEPEEGENLIENLGGPEILSWNDIVAIFSRVLGKPLKKMHTPARVYRIAADVLETLSPPAGNLMAMSWVASMSDTAFDGKPLAERFGVRLTTAEEFLRARAALPPEAG